MKFLFIIKQPLTTRDFKRFGIDSALERGHVVTVLDLTDAIHPGMHDESRNYFKDRNIRLIVIRNWQHLKAEQASFAESDLAFLLIQSYGLARKIYRTLRILGEHKTPYLILSPAVYPGWRATDRSWKLSQFFKDIYSRLRGMDPVNSLISRLPPSLLNIPMAAFFVRRSPCEGYSNNLIGPGTKIINAHTDDYEIFLKEKNCHTPTKNQAVFLDQFMPFHVDFLELNSTHINADKYFDGLRRLFDRIERELEVEIIIAAHPHADHYNRPNLFGNRRIISDKTVSLVAESRLVLAHNSTAIGFAVAFNKPVMLITNNELYYFQVYEKYAYDALSRELGTPLRFYDDPETVNLSGAFNFNPDLYERYLNIYMRCPNTPLKPFWENVLGAVETENPVMNENLKKQVI